jgi:hypothetical protein
MFFVLRLRLNSLLQFGVKEKIKIFVSTGSTEERPNLTFLIPRQFL